MTELWQLGALESAGKIRNRQVSSHEVVEARLERVEACNGSLDAIMRVLTDRFSDLRVLTIAAEIEALVGAITPIDPITS